MTGAAVVLQIEQRIKNKSKNWRGKKLVIWSGTKERKWVVMEGRRGGEGEGW